MHTWIDALAQLIERCEPLGSEREVQVELDGAPASVVRLVGAMARRQWNIRLGGYELRDSDEAPVRTLLADMEHLDFDHELDQALSRAGAAGGAFDPTRAVMLGPDGGGMSLLAVGWSDGTLALVALELDDDPNNVGLLQHFLTEGAALAFLRSYMEAAPGDLDALEALVVAAGGDLEPGEPVRSQPCADPPTRPSPAAGPPPLPNAYGLGDTLKAAIETGDTLAIDAVLARFDGPLQNPSLKAAAVMKAFYETREAHPDGALRAARWFMDDGLPDSPLFQGEWLNMLIFVGEVCANDRADPTVRRELIERCIDYVGRNSDIRYHPIVFYAKNGPAERARELIARARADGYPHLGSLLGEPGVKAFLASEAALGADGPD